MTTRLTVLDWVMIALIVLFSGFNAAMLSGVFRGEEALAAFAVSDPSLLPLGNAPGIDDRSEADIAEDDASAALPGRFVPAQGRSHTAAWPLRGNQRVPYCPVGRYNNECYASNPPTSGLHVPVERAARLSAGVVTQLPPDPGIYDFDLPREAVPHLQEHAGVFVGYNCESDACRAAVRDLEAVVLQELSLGARVVMAPFSDLAPDTIAAASWTRYDVVVAAGWDPERFRTFIKAHSCRFDPEGFCIPQRVS